MKKLICTVLIGLFSLVVFEADAQTMTKAERKELKREIKTYKKNPEKWVRLMNRQKEKVEELDAEILALKGQLSACETGQADLKAQNEELEAKLNVMMDKYKGLLNSQPSTALPGGTVYQVQMGYFQQLNLMSFNNKLKTVRAEDVNGAKRYVIGYFDNLMDAMQFSNDIKTLGISDAFVSQYIDGIRNMNFNALDVIGTPTLTEPY